MSLRSPGGSVYLTEPVVRELRMLAIEGFIALPRRGMEVGGILLGHARGNAIHIEGFEEASCEHRYGPSYALSDTDRALLSHRLERHQSGDSLPVIGFFRSFTSRDPVIEAADEEFVRERFPQGDFVFLMLHPLSPESCLASFRFFRDGELLPETGDLPFPFDPAHMQAGEPAPKPQPVIDTTPTPVSPIPPAPQPVPIPAPEPAPVFEAPMHEPPMHEAPMHEPPIIAEPPPQPRTRWWIPLAVCLISGIGGAAIYELWTLARAPRWAELHLDARPAGSQLNVTWDASAPAAASATRALLAVTDGDTHRDIGLTAAQIHAGHYTYTPAHPDIALRLILYGKGVGVAGDAVRVAAIPNPNPVDMASRTDADRAAAEPAPDAGPSAGPAARVVTQASITREVQPSIPSGIRSRIQEQIVIPVDVRIDEKGRVTSAKTEVAGSDGVRRYLATQSEKAARQWRFTPARARGGTRVASTRTLHFVFSP